MPLLSAVSSAVFKIISPMVFTASIFMPLFVVPTFIDEHTLSVEARASGIDRHRFVSPRVKPL